MIDEFTKWVKNVKILIEKRVKKYNVKVYLIKNGTPFCRGLDSHSVQLLFSNGITFWCSFHREEFNRNNYHQRRRLAKIRREDLAWEMKDYCEEIIRVANLLS